MVLAGPRAFRTIERNCALVSLKREIAALDRGHAVLRDIAIARGKAISSSALGVPFQMPAWRLREIEKLRAQLADPAEVETRDGVLYWRSNRAVVPPHVFRDAMVELPARQVAARDAAERKFIAAYRRQQKGRKPSAEELHEMRAAFGPGVTHVNALTGRRTRT